MNGQSEKLPDGLRSSADRNQDQFIHFRFFRRSCYEWAVWLIWLLVELFILQNAIASGAEYEYRAALLYWVIFGVLLLAGMVTYVMRRIMVIERQQYIDDWGMNDDQEQSFVRKNP